MESELQVGLNSCKADLPVLHHAGLPAANEKTSRGGGGVRKSFYGMNRKGQRSTIPLKNTHTHRHIRWRLKTVVQLLTEKMALQHLRRLNYPIQLSGQVHTLCTSFSDQDHSLMNNHKHVLVVCLDCVRSLHVLALEMFTKCLLNGKHHPFILNKYWFPCQCAVEHVCENKC